MVLLPAGLVFGKAIMNNLATRRGALQAATPVVAARTRAFTGSPSDGGIVRGKKKEDALQKPDRAANPFSAEEVRQRLGGTGVRMNESHAEREAIALKEALDNEEWLAVYRFTGIRFGVLLARAKLVQTIASVLYLPYSGMCLLMGTASKEAFVSSLVIGIFAPLMLFIFSRYLNRLVGVIAMNPSKDFIRVGYLTFWGSRKNKYLEGEDGE